MGLQVPQSSTASVLHTAFTGANVGTSETDMSTYTLPANSMSVNGKAMRIIVWGVTAANANAKTIKLYFGATEIARPMNNNVGSDFAWSGTAYVIRTGAATQNANSRIGAGTAAVLTNESSTDAMAVSPTETMSGSIVIRVTGTSNTASNDVLLKGFIIELLN